MQKILQIITWTIIVSIGLNVQAQDTTIETTTSSDEAPNQFISLHFPFYTSNFNGNYLYLQYGIEDTLDNESTAYGLRVSPAFYGDAYYGKYLIYFHEKSAVRLLVGAEIDAGFFFHHYPSPIYTYSLTTSSVYAEFVPVVKLRKTFAEDFTLLFGLKTTLLGLGIENTSIDNPLLAEEEANQSETFFRMRLNPYFIIGLNYRL